MNLYKIGKYKYSRCECGQHFYQSARWVDKKKCICNDCKEDITKRIQDKWKLVHDKNGKLIIK